MKWKELLASPYEARVWQARSGRRRYTIHEISDREGDLYVLDVVPGTLFGFPPFVDRDGNETAARTSRAEFRSKEEAVRAARKHVQKHSRRRS